MITPSERIAIIAGERSISFNQMLQYINNYSQLTPKEKGERTLIFADNSEAWIYAFYSIWANKGIPVPVDASSTVSDVAYIVRDCTPVCIWTNAHKRDTVEKALEEAGSEAQILIIEEYIDYSSLPEPTEHIVNSLPLRGDGGGFDEVKDNTAVIIYTSGTTGSPKGVMLSFENILVNIKAVSEEVEIFNKDRRTLILLPLHHVLPLVGTVVMPMYAGGGVAICPSMSGPDIMATLQRGKVAILIGVPRLWQTLYGAIKKKIDSKPVARMMFNMCAKANSLSLSRKVFKQVHDMMGGHVKYFVSGGAALDRDIALGLQTLGLELLEGYGMTEAAPMIAFTRPGDLVPNCVGLPLNATECRIINGEVCAKGPNIMQGYYNRPEETAAVIDKDGFLHTGDLGRIDEKGRIYITGRSKEIIVLSNGKNVQPFEIEYKLEKYTERVKEAAVVQDGDLLKAIIVPQTPWADNLGDQEVEEILKREVIEPYNTTVTNYKKLKSLMVYRGELPRTKLEKLQRFKLKDILAGAKVQDAKCQESDAKVQEPDSEEYRIIKEYIFNEKKITIKPTDHIETDLAFDSLDMVSLEGFIKQTFGTTINAANMPTYRNMQALAEYVAFSKTRIEVEVEDWHSFLNSDSTTLELPRAAFTLPLINNVASSLFKVYNRLEIKGKENIPSVGPFIIAPNHQSFLDGPVVTAGLPSKVLKNTYFFATEEHVRSGLRKALARNNNVILMERDNLRDSILKLAKVLKQGSNVIIFPEGRRTNTGEMGTFKKTFAILATELNIPVLPVRITGAYQALSRDSSVVKPHKITVEYLPVVIPSSSISYDELSDIVQAAIEG